MSVKKTQPKRAKKKNDVQKESTRKKVSKKVHQDIERAVDKIPGILTEHVRFSETTSHQNLSSHTSPKYMKDAHTLEVEQQKRRLLWIGVTCLISIILVMWLWNARLAIYSLVRQPNNAPWQSTKADFSSAMATLAKQDEELNRILAATVPTTSTPATSTTPETEEKLKASLLSLFATSTTSTEPTEQTVTTTNIQL